VFTEADIQLSVSRNGDVEDREAFSLDPVEGRAGASEQFELTTSRGTRTIGEVAKISAVPAVESYRSTGEGRENYPCAHCNFISPQYQRRG
jgi:hypothetical protein